MSCLFLAAPLRWAVPADAGYDFYSIFYVLAFALNLALLVWEGRRRGYALRPWLVLLACTTLAFILGTKLLAFSGAEWRGLLATGHWPDSGARTVLGGALAGSLTLLALRRPFGFSWHVFDAFTLPMCAALVVQCVGCVLTGCCFGEATAGGWGLTYPPDTLPYLVQAVRGTIPPHAAHSLPVHPTQLYSLLLCAGVALVLVLTRHRPWPGGSRRLLHLGLLLTGRLLIEFWRDPASEQVGAATRVHLGIALKQVQWALLLLGPAVLGWWAWQLRRAHHRAPRPEHLPTQDPLRNLLAVAALLLLTAWLGQQALTRPEVLVVKALLLGVLVLEGGALLLGTAGQLRPLRVALPLGLASVVFVLTSQVPADSTRRELEISLGAGNGRYLEEVTSGGGGGCSGPLTRETYAHRYQILGGTAELHRPSSYKAHTIGLGLWLGSDRITYGQLDPYNGGVFSQTDSTKRLFDINPYIAGSSQLRPGKFGLGYRAGLHMGRLTHHGKREFLEPELFNFDLALWAGVRDKLFAQADVNQGPLGLGNHTHRLALGSGLGRVDGGSVLAGLALARNSPNPSMGFVSADLRLGRTGFTFYPYAATNFARMHQLNFRLGYRIPLKKP